MKKIVLFLFVVFLVQVNLFSQSCLPDGIIFTSQTQIDSFKINYPNCSEIEGDVEINGDDIVSLDSLNDIISIGGGIRIKDCNTLINLNGLNNLNEIGSYCMISENDSLLTLSGLENLSYIDGFLELSGNYSLINIDGLNNLDSINGYLALTYSKITNMNALTELVSISGTILIESNDSLTNLVGLENIDPNSVSGIYLYNNPLLSQCAVESICEALTDPSTDVYIENNSTGCNSREEVEQACLSHENIRSLGDTKIKIYPNPAFNEFSISSGNTTCRKIIIYNQFGQKLMSVIQPDKKISVKSLNPGVYFVEIITDKTITTGKLILK